MADEILNTNKAKLLDQMPGHYTSQKVNTEPSGDVIPVGVLTEPPVVDSDEDELVEELAATTTINGVFDEFITNLRDSFEDLKFTSEESNPVRTHLHIVDLEEAVLTEAYAVKARLINTLAKRGGEFAEKGGLLRTQVIDESPSDEGAIMPEFGNQPEVEV